MTDGQKNRALGGCARLPATSASSAAPFGARLQPLLTALKSPRPRKTA